MCGQDSASSLEENSATCPKGALVLSTPVSDFDLTTRPDYEEISKLFENQFIATALSDSFDRTLYEPLWHSCVRVFYFIQDIKMAKDSDEWHAAISRYINHTFSPFEMEEFAAQLGLAILDALQLIDLVFGLLDPSMFHPNSIFAMIGKNYTATMKPWIFGANERKNQEDQRDKDLFAKWKTETADEFEATDKPWFADLADDVKSTLKKIPKSELLQKAYKVFMGLLCYPIAKKFGLFFSEYGLMDFSERHMKKFKFGTVTEMVMSVVDLLHSMATMGHVCFAERSLAPILRAEHDLEHFINRCIVVQDAVTASFSNPAWDPNDVISELVELREIGHVLMMCCEHKVYVSREVSKLDKLFIDLSQRSGVSAFRRAPFSLMIFGTPGIGKSFITNMLISYYHQVVTSEKIYPDLKWNPKLNIWTKNFSDDFDSDYKGASQWAVVLDDLGQENVSHVKAGVTNSIMNLFSLVNNVGYASTQAELEYKGKIPKVPKLVIASTNVKHLNAYFAVAEASAALRRLPIVIEPILKDEFKNPGSGTMKQSDTAQRDAWFFKVQEVHLKVHDGKSAIEYKDIKGSHPDGYMTIHEVFPYLRSKIIAHEENQKAFQEALAPTDGDCICDRCFVPKHYCKCCFEATAFWTPPRSSFNESVRTTSLRFCMFLYDYGFIHPSTLVGVLHYLSPALCRELVLLFIRRKIPSNFLRMSDIVKGALLGSFTCMLLSIVGKYCFPQKPTPMPEASSGIWHKQDEAFNVPQRTYNDDGQSIVKTLTKSMLTLVISSAGDKPRGLNAVNIGDGNILTTGHIFVPGFEEWACSVRYSKGEHVDQSQVFMINRGNLTFIDGTDLVIINSGYNVPRRNLRPFLSATPSSARGIVRLISRNKDGEFMQERGQILDYSKNFSYTHEGRIITVDEAVSFVRESGNTVRGDCGSIILANSERGWYVHSMVCAGNLSGTGIAIPLSAKLIASAKSIFSTYNGTSYFAAGNNKTGPSVPISDRNITVFSAGGKGEIVCSFTGRTSPVSHVVDSKHSLALKAVLPIEHEYGPPVMRAILTPDGWKNPWVLNLNETLFPNSLLPESEIERAARSFLFDLSLNIEWLKDVKPVSERIAINGIPGNHFVNALPMSTSGGFVQPGPKRALFDYDENENCYVSKAHLSDRLESLRSCYLSGERSSALMSAHLKDEPVSFKKIKACKTRVFTGCSVDLSIVMREQFLLVTEAIMRNNFHSECMVGMNCYSESWSDLFYYFTRGEESCDRMINGDFGKYDKRMASIVIRWSFWILTKLCESTGRFSSDDLLIQRGIMTDICYPFVNYNGDVIMFYGSNSSGHPLTVIINSIANSIYMRFAYARISGLTIDTFRANIRLGVLGDDNAMSSLVDSFNHTALSKCLAEVGIEYTMADKTSESVPFSSIFDHDFLKRKFAKLDGKIVAPLELESTFKSLVCLQQRGNITNAEQTAQCYLSARREWSLHGQLIFDDLCSRVDAIFDLDEEIVACYIKQHKFDWRKTFDWVCSGKLEEVPDIEGEFFACERQFRNFSSRNRAALVARDALEAIRIAEQSRLAVEHRDARQQRRAEQRAIRKALLIKNYGGGNFSAHDIHDQNEADRYVGLVRQAENLNLDDREIGMNQIGSGLNTVANWPKPVDPHLLATSMFSPILFEDSEINRDIEWTLDQDEFPSLPNYFHVSELIAPPPFPLARQSSWADLSENDQDDEALYEYMSSYEDDIEDVQRSYRHHAYSIPDLGEIEEDDNSSYISV